MTGATESLAETRPDRRAALILLVAALGWPLIEVVGGGLMLEHPAEQVVVLRYTAHLFLLVPFALLRFGPGIFRTKRPVLQLLRGFSMFLMPVVFVAGARVDGSAWVWSAFWSLVALVLVGSLLVGERPVATAWIVAAVGFTGSWFARGSPIGGSRSAALGIASAICFGGYVVLSRVLREEELATSLFYTAVGALVPTLVLVAPIWVPLGAADLAPALGLGVFSLLILGSIDLSLERAKLSVVVPFLVVIPALEVAVGAGLGHGMPGRRALFGCGLILAAAALWLLRFEGLFPFRRPLALPASDGRHAAVSSAHDTRSPGGAS